MSIMDQNSEIRVTLFKSVEDLDDQQLNQRVTEDKWTIAQVLIHLYLLEKGVSKSIKGALESSISQPAEPKPVHLTPDRGKKIKAPTFLEPRDEFVSMVEIKKKLSESRETLNHLLVGVDEHTLEQKSFPHPAFGQMNLKQWVEFVGLHEKRHLEQIEELKQDLSK